MIYCEHKRRALNNILYSSLEYLAVDIKDKVEDMESCSLDEVIEENYTRSATEMQNCLAHKCKVCSLDLFP